MAADGAGRRARRIDQNCVKCPFRLPLTGVGDNLFAARSRRTRLLATVSSRGCEMSTAVTWPPKAASWAVLPPGAAHRSGDPAALQSAQAGGRQRSGGILDPPCTLAKAHHLRDRAFIGAGDRAGRQQFAAEPLRPASASDFAVMSRAGLLQRGQRHRMSTRLSKVVAPFVDQPSRKVERGRILAGNSLASGFVDAAQHGVDQLVEPAEARFSRVSRTAVSITAWAGSSRKKQLRRTGQEDELGPRAMPAAASTAIADNGAELAGSAQNRCRD